MKTIVCDHGKKIRRLSRWIKIRHAYNVTPRHSLYDFCTDGRGFHPYHKEYNPQDGNYLDYFVFRNRKYAVEDFFSCGSMYIPDMWIWEEKDGLHFMSGVEMSGNIFHSLLIEIEPNGEYLRVYEECV